MRFGDAIGNVMISKRQHLYPIGLGTHDKIRRR